MSARSLVYFGADPSQAPPELIQRFGTEHDLRLEIVPDAEEIHALLNRSFPACIILDARGGSEPILDLCRAVKSDAFTAIVPVVLLASAEDGDTAAEGLEAGADEVVIQSISEREQWLRLELLLRRAARDVSVHPTTRLPGTVQIERDLADRIARGGNFAICYADLDHFKEFNDRYGYNHGDQVILLVSKILRDLVRGLAPGGFVGHIGGDDFIFNIPIEAVESCCDEVISLFDELVPYQYTEEDRRAGYFLGRDRRGSVHRIPLMTLSIGVVTNRQGGFTHTAQVSELAAEMKSYAKTLPGSVYVVDRRGPGLHAAGADADEEKGQEERPRQESTISGT